MSDLVWPVTCGKHRLRWEGLVVYDGELGQLDVFHPGDGAGVAPSLPVELDVVSRVSIWRRQEDMRREPDCDFTCTGVALIGFIELMETLSHRVTDASEPLLVPIVSPSDTFPRTIITHSLVWRAQICSPAARHQICCCRNRFAPFTRKGWFSAVLYLRFVDFNFNFHSERRF